MSKKYITNKDLVKEIIISKAQGKRTRDLERMIVLLAKNVIRKKIYSDQQLKEDIESYMILRMLIFWDRYNEDKFDNAFAFMTEVGKRAMAEGFNQWNKKDRNSGEYYNIVSMNDFYRDGTNLNI